MTSEATAVVAAQPLAVVRHIARSEHTIDVLSYDPGTRNCGVVHVRIDLQAKQLCILHAALLDLLNPQQSLCLRTAQRQQPQESRVRKPTVVEPYSYCWPRAEQSDDNQFVWRARHIAALAVATSLDEQQKPNFPELVALLPHTLNAVGWLRGTDLNHVVIEVQDPQNAKMRSLAHSLQTYYETYNIAQRSDGDCIQIHYLSARLKLSAGVLDAIDMALHFVPDSERSSGIGTLRGNIVDLTQPETSSPPAQTKTQPPLLSSVVNRENHARRKTSAKLVFEALQDRFGCAAPFLAWVERQRATKHNVLDALLQCWAWCLEQGYGFDDALLRDTRRRQQRAKAIVRRQAAKRKVPTDSDADVSVSVPQNVSAQTTDGPSAVPTPKRRRVTLSRAVVHVELD